MTAGIIVPPIPEKNAMQKYQMIQENRLKTYLSESRLLGKQPFHAFATAVHFGLAHEAHLVLEIDKTL